MGYDTWGCAPAGCVGAGVCLQAEGWVEPGRCTHKPPAPRQRPPWSHSTAHACYISSPVNRSNILNVARNGKPMMLR